MSLCLVGSSSGIWVRSSPAARGSCWQKMVLCLSRSLETCNISHSAKMQDGRVMLAGMLFILIPSSFWFPRGIFIYFSPNESMKQWWSWFLRASGPLLATYTAAKHFPRADASCLVPSTLLLAQESCLV